MKILDGWTSHHSTKRNNLFTAGARTNYLMNESPDHSVVTKILLDDDAVIGRLVLLVEDAV